MVEKITDVPGKNKEWKLVEQFGKGGIFASGNERKLVTPGSPDFEYNIQPELNNK
jgi:hypothetical protein